MELIKGKHAVLEALKSDIELDRIIVAFQSHREATIQKIIGTAKSQSIKVQTVSPKEFEKITSEKHSQGIIAFIKAKEMIELEDIVTQTEKFPIVVVLDHIEDPHNLGAILRTCEAFGVNGIVFPKDRACQITPGAIKASSGAIHYLSLCRVVNISRSLALLQSNGYWLYGADADSGKALGTVKINTPAALVVGNENKGMSRLARNQLDECIKIPMKGRIGSLNVSVATGIFIYEFTRSIH